MKSTKSKIAGLLTAFVSLAILGTSIEKADAQSVPDNSVPDNNISDQSRFLQGIQSPNPYQDSNVQDMSPMSIEKKKNPSEFPFGIGSETSGTDESALDLEDENWTHSGDPRPSSTGIEITDF